MSWNFYLKTYEEKYRGKRPIKDFLSAFRYLLHSARKRHIHLGGTKNNRISLFELNRLFFKQQQTCFFSGRPLLPGNISMDRVDNSFPYIAGNIRLVIKEINIAKHLLPADDFIQLCKDVANKN